MSNTYTDYVNKVAITVPDRYIDVKTGEAYSVSSKIVDQIEFHAENSSLSHLVLSALHHYLNPKNAGSAEILQQLADIRSMLENGTYLIQPPVKARTGNEQTDAAKLLNMKEVEDILEAFGG